MPGSVPGAAATSLPSHFPKRFSRFHAVQRGALCDDLGMTDARILGIDARTIVPALLVLALAVVMSIVLPTIDSRTEYHDEVQSGDVAQVADGITLLPAAGWNLASGALVGQTRSPVGSTASTELVNGSVDFYAQAAPFAGTTSALLTRINRINDDLRRARGRTAETTHRYAVTTKQGVAGVAEDFVSLTRQGTIVAFVFRRRGQTPREGLEVVAAGPAGAMSRRRDEIVAMIRSIRVGS
jgi:hypothetical protein